jgi:hypothetical protein
MLQKCTRAVKLQENPHFLRKFQERSDFASYGGIAHIRKSKDTNLGTDLVSALAGLQVDDFPHVVCAVVRLSGRGAESRVVASELTKSE